MSVVQRKLVLVGDGNVGKTCLLLRYAKDSFSPTYTPTVFETTIVDVEVDGTSVELSLWDTAGQEDYDRLRPLSYTDTDVVLIVFSVVRPDTLKNVSLKWKTEVAHFCPDAPTFLIGSKCDLRGSGAAEVSPATGEATAKQIGAQAYIECSALADININKVFTAATRAALHASGTGSSGSKKKKCVIL